MFVLEEEVDRIVTESSNTFSCTLVIEKTSPCDIGVGSVSGVLVGASPEGLMGASIELTATATSEGT